jgi:large subunit ribosomal protein L10
LLVNRAEKQRLVEDLRGKFVRNDVVILTRFTGLKVGELGELRRGLKKISAEYKVVKNTLLQRAMEGTDVALLRERIRGPLAVVVGKGDLVPVAKALVDYMKDHPKFEIEAGVTRGRVLDANEIRQAATLPGREELVAKLMFLMQAPVAGLIGVLREIPAKLVRTLDEIRKQKESQA